MGISFMKQWAAAGLNKEIKLYSGFTVDYSTLPAIGAAAIGTVHAQMWDPEGQSPANQRFVKEYVARFGAMPSDFAVQAYDAAGLIAAGVKGTGGKVDDGAALVLAMRRHGLDSVRGRVKYNVNGFPIQPFYKRTVVAGADGQPKIVVAGAVTEQKDAYWERCPAPKRAG
jgi:branched-chain amino acid transport system substrate-binding protein